MTKELAIVGASGHGKVIADIAEQLGYTVRFYDDAYPSKKNIEHWPIYGACEDLIASSDGQAENAVVAIGNNDIRAEKISLLQQHNFTLVTLIDPSAVISQYAKIAPGCVVFPGAVINAFASIGKGCIINTSAVVEHDCKLGDFTHICPNVALAGGVSVGSKSWLGIGSQVKQLVSIGGNSLIGAGSTVIKNIPDNVTSFGSPAIVVTNNK
ncbi:acetyltransferase [Psychrosphaera aquimarina]|uniref:Acetyltransferase n=1 Tax=Psychrosphaera aquimarina TaxID=2044854 RepID=A0ABU3R542_9GAMM|nr:acetyltransferase [Psychrosphaera aquimarina]MDU0114575.1 acetyltransferase [Psychrosphaera aquimarina]